MLERDTKRAVEGDVVEDPVTRPEIDAISG
jgi:hypothetical protein